MTYRVRLWVDVQADNQRNADHMMAEFIRDEIDAGGWWKRGAVITEEKKEKK